MYCTVDAASNTLTKQFYHDENMLMLSLFIIHCIKRLRK